MKGLLTLCVEHFFSRMRGRVATPSMLDFAMAFLPTVKELVKRHTCGVFQYFTAADSYYPPPAESLYFSDLRIKGCKFTNTLTAAQKTATRAFVDEHGRTVRQNTVRNLSTRDKPGTLPISMYDKAAADPTMAVFGVLPESAVGARASAVRNDANQSQRLEQSTSNQVSSFALNCVLY